MVTKAFVDARLRFPSQEVIMDYLSKHPRARDPYNKEKKINETVARHFANSARAAGDLQMGVILAMKDLETIQLPTSAILIISKNLAQALEDCASGKKIEQLKGNIPSKL